MSSSAAGRSKTQSSSGSMSTTMTAAPPPSTRYLQLQSPEGSETNGVGRHSTGGNSMYRQPIAAATPAQATPSGLARRQVSGSSGVPRDSSAPVARVSYPRYAASVTRGVSAPGTSTLTTAAEPRILGERTVETEVRIPRLRVTEETIEKLVVVPETIRHEEMVEETQRVRERIIEVEKPVVHQRVVEVPDIEYVEKVVEVPQTIVKEQVREVPRIEVQEHITYKPRVVVHEKVEQVPEVEIVEVPVDKIVEVPEIREQIVIKEVPVNRFVEYPVPEFVDVEVEQEVHRNIPVPVQCVTTVKYEVPGIAVEYEKIPIPIYAPRFVEVPVPVEQMDQETFVSAMQLLQEVAVLSSQEYPSLCEVENLGASAKTFNPTIVTDIEAISQAWKRAAVEALHSGGSHRGNSPTAVTSLKPLESQEPSAPKLFLTRRSSRSSNTGPSWRKINPTSSTPTVSHSIDNLGRLTSQPTPLRSSMPHARRYFSVPNSN